jgi:hypothetical protein
MRTRVSMVAMVAALLLGVIGLPGYANPPDESGVVERFDVGIFYFFEGDGFVALGGPPPEEGCIGEGFDDLLTVQAVDHGDGVQNFLTRGDQDLWVYAASSVDQVCETLAGGGTPELLASGTVRLVALDNDIDVSGTRTNSFGGSVSGRLETPDGGSCRFRGTERYTIQDGEFRVLVSEAVLTC